MERYQRQIILKEMGLEGQQKLQAAKVLVVGAGGLGCPALQYLAAAGIGNIGIVDQDTVQISNLHRQTLYTMADVGLQKATIAAEALQRMNGSISIVPYPFQLTNQNAWDLIAGYDIIVDGTDNFETRYLINDACVLQGKPLVYGSIFKYEGQVCVFNSVDEEIPAINYRHLFPTPPKEVPNCAEAGVIGVLPGIIGSLQAAEAIKLVTGIGKPLANQLLVYDMLENTSMKFQVPFNTAAAGYMPRSRQEFETKDYGLAACDTTAMIQEITVEDFEAAFDDEQVTIIDVREPGEEPLVDSFPHLKIPLSDLSNEAKKLSSKKLILFCAFGKRSLLGAKIVSTLLPSNTSINSLKGGIINWMQQPTKH